MQHQQYTRGEKRDHNNYDTIDNESYDVDVHNDNDDEVDDGDDGKCNANNDVEDNDDEMIIAILMIIQ